MPSLLPLSEFPPSASLRFGPAGWQPWYDSIIDWVLTHPGGKWGECARDLRKSLSWISLVVNTDLFKARLALRRKAFNAELNEIVTARLGEVAVKSLEAIADKLDKQKGNIPLKSLTEVADRALTHLGYGVPPPAPAGAAQVNVIVNTVAPSVIEAARRSLREMETRAVPPAGFPAATEVGLKELDRLSRRGSAEVVEIEGEVGVIESTSESGVRG